MPNSLAATAADAVATEFCRRRREESLIRNESRYLDSYNFEYAAPTGLEFGLGCGSTMMPRLRRYGEIGDISST